MSDSALTLQMPPLPEPVPVAINPATTALLILDIVDPICSTAGAGQEGRCYDCLWDSSANHVEVACGSSSGAR
jgi:hypothetical protein